MDVGFVQDGAGQAALLFEQGCKQVLDIELLMAVAGGLALRRPDGLLEFFSETIDIHKLSLSLSTNLSLPPACAVVNF